MGPRGFPVPCSPVLLNSVLTRKISKINYAIEANMCTFSTVHGLYGSYNSAFPGSEFKGVVLSTLINLCVFI